MNELLIRKYVQFVFSDKLRKGPLKRGIHSLKADIPNIRESLNLNTYSFGFLIDLPSTLRLKVTEVLKGLHIL